jgi:hypothetical protein
MSLLYAYIHTNTRIHTDRHTITHLDAAPAQAFERFLYSQHLAAPDCVAAPYHQTGDPSWPVVAAMKQPVAAERMTHFAAIAMPVVESTLVPVRLVAAALMPVYILVSESVALIAACTQTAEKKPVYTP